MATQKKAQTYPEVPGFDISGLEGVPILDPYKGEAEAHRRGMEILDRGRVRRQAKKAAEEQEQKKSDS